MQATQSVLLAIVFFFLGHNFNPFLKDVAQTWAHAYEVEHQAAQQPAAEYPDDYAPTTYSYSYDVQPSDPGTVRNVPGKPLIAPPIEVDPQSVR